MAAGQQRHRRLHDGLGRVAGRHEGEVDRKRHHRHAQQQHGMGQQVQPGAAFNHGAGLSGNHQ